MMTMLQKGLAAGLLLFISACTVLRKGQEQTVKGLTFLGDYTIPHRLPFRGTTIGGLSGIEYVQREDAYYLICDDRSDINPARFYKARIFLGAKGIDSVGFTDMVILRQPGGRPYPNRKQDSLRVPDPEALRLHLPSGHLLWSSEGERLVRGDRVILNHPAIYQMTKEGQVVDSFPLPSNLRMSIADRGPRQNGVLEGLSFTPDYRWLFAGMEEPLYEDGPRAGLGDTTGWIRIIRYDVASRQPVTQYAYQIDPVVQEPISRGAFVVNGVPDILALNDHQLLVTERSFSTGRLTCNVRVYLAELNGAENIASNASLKTQPPQKPLRKKLLLNMDTLGRWVDNVEGATFGPTLPNGKRSLLFVTDDNFAAVEKTQFFLFQVED